MSKRVIRLLARWPGDPEKWIKEKVWYLLNLGSYRNNFNAWFTSIWSFIMRLQPSIRDAVNNGVKKSLKHYENNTLYLNSISLPVRGSDKCLGHKLKRQHSGEMICFTPKEYISVCFYILGLCFLVLSSISPKIGDTYM